MDLQVLTIVALVFLGTARSSQLDSSTNAKILKYDYKNDAAGHYYFEYETSDGQSREEQGDLKHAETNHEELVVKGSYSFTGADGVVYTVTYTADKDGFHPEGDHIKVPPYIPWPVNQYSDHHPNPSGEVPTTYTSTSPPPRPEVRISNTYIPSTPTPRPTPRIIDPVYNPSNGISRAYIPSTPGPFRAVISDTHLGAGSSQVKVTKKVSKRPVKK